MQQPFFLMRLPRRQLPDTAGGGFDRKRRARHRSQRHYPNRYWIDFVIQSSRIQRVLPPHLPASKPENGTEPIAESYPVEPVECRDNLLRCFAFTAIFKNPRVSGFYADIECI